MADDVNVPKLGKIRKRVLIPIVVAAGGFIAWRYYADRSGVGDGDAATDPGFEDPGALPPVAGAVKPDNSYGDGEKPPASQSDYGFTGTTNAQWSQYVINQLEQGDRWSYADIATALGNFLDHRALSDLQQQIVRAAIAVAGYPPVGSYTIISGGNTPITVAPSGIGLTATPTTISVSFTPVAGARSYNAYRSNTTGVGTFPHGTSDKSPIVLTGLVPNTTYSIQVAAVSSSGAVGPKSAARTIKTPGVKLAIPARPTVSAITKTSAVVSTKPVSWATGYRWYINGVFRATSDGPTFTMTRLTSRATYKVSVAADSPTLPQSGLSPVVSFRTK